jgi:hypothetical protein
MEREHLIIIALILVALYMMNSSSSKDKVTGIAPAKRIRYGGPLDGFIEGQEPFAMLPERIRHGDRDYGKGHFIKNHIRHNNRNNMFSGMMGDCEGFRFTGGQQDCAGGVCEDY